jgi:hypothetical protein
MAFSLPPPSLLLDDVDAWQGLASDFSSSLTLVPTLGVSSSSDPSITAPPSAGLSSLSSGASGKFNVFSFVGASISGGAVKRFLVHLKADDDHEDFCLGMVGSLKFCLKGKLPGSNSCGTGRHGTSKCLVAWHALYVKFTDTQVYT